MPGPGTESNCVSEKGFAWVFRDAGVRLPLSDGVSFLIEGNITKRDLIFFERSAQSPVLVTGLGPEPSRSTAGFSSPTSITQAPFGVLF